MNPIVDLLNVRTWKHVWLPSKNAAERVSLTSHSPGQAVIFAR